MYVTHPLFIHLGISNFNWVFKISKTGLFAYFAFFNWVFLYMLKLSMILQFVLRHIHSRMEATFSLDFRHVYSR